MDMVYVCSQTYIKFLIMIQAVIFDMDGVLIDSEPLHFSAIEEVLLMHGITIQKGYLDKFVGDTNERAWEVMKKEFRLQDAIGFYIKQQIQRTIDCLWRDDYGPIEGVPELLQQLKSAGYPLAIASSSPPEIIQNIIDRIGIGSYIDKWVSGNEVQESKPAPDIYLRAAEMLGYKPANCLAVEDSYYGVTAAKAAGMKCIGYKAMGAIEQDLSAADVIVTNMNDISIELIKGMNII